MSTDGQCPFCHLLESRGWLTTPLCVAFYDALAGRLAGEQTP